MEGGTIVLISLVLTLGQPGLSLLNLSLKRQTNSTYYREGRGPSSLVVDGNDSDLLNDPDNASIPQCLYTMQKQKTAFWQVDLEQKVVLDHVVIIFRKGGTGQLTHQIRRNGYSILVTSSSVYLPELPVDTCYHDSDPSLSSANHENRSCNNIGSYVTIYNQRNTLSGNKFSQYAVLELCEVKVMGCPLYKHGANCTENCSVNCIKRLCFPANGDCMQGCQPGYKDSTCEIPCDNYFYGNNCVSKCHCKRGPCNVTNGICPSGGCSPGYNGSTCSTKCEGGTFGDNCENNCGECNTGTKTCDYRNGSCTSGCKPGFKPSQCIEVCDPGSYGRNCTHDCGSCLDGEPCHHINGTCLNGCVPGKRGNKCDLNCTAGTYGRNCTQHCGNCLNGSHTCTKTNGSCPDGCLAGWQKPTCKSACEPGHYGINCAEPCGKCKNDQTCNRTDGTCEDGCSPGWNGSFCKERCSIGWYGEACKEKCGNCAEERNCHHIHGTCPQDNNDYVCDPGKKGEKCKTDCSYNEYGSDCSQICGRCFNLSCDSVSGNCTEGCLQGWAGVQCVIKHNALSPPTSSSGFVIAAITAVIVAIAIVTIVIVVVKKRRGRQMPYSSPQYDDDQQNEIGALYENMAADTHIDEETNHIDQMTYENVGNISRNDQQQNGVLKENLPQEIVRKEECDEFIKDFKEFLSGSQFPCEEALKAENKSRNRYKTTFPYDHSRVILDGNQDYINANFIKDLEGTNAYVATQGPKASTLHDFWRMIWQLKTGKIVMLAKCVELGKFKVEKYWPDSGSSIQHGSMNISCISSTQCEAYTVRKFSLENENADERRVITQFHFTKWPDHGTPDVIRFALLLQDVQSVDSKLCGPMVVHCSAGVGRTGTFIALDVLFRHGKTTGRVDPPAYIQSMRRDRMDMVQTKLQYVFIYQALVELFLIDNTTLTMTDFDSKCLKSPRLLQEYEKLNGKRPTIPKNQLSGCMIPKNKEKNRDPKILPCRSYRPILSSQPASKTDYINAVFVPSLQSYDGYIVTQWPLLHTADDFWTMIYDYKSMAIAILDSDADTNDPKLMPSQEESEITAGNFTVQISGNSRTESSVTMTEVCLSKMGDDASHKIKIFRVCNWPQDQQKCAEGRVTEIAYAVHECQRNFTSGGPVTVVCRDGSSKCGIFCTVANAIENINLNQQVSLIQVVRQLQLRRPSFISTYESYVMCNREVKVHFDALSEYQNYEGPSS